MKKLLFLLMFQMSVYFAIGQGNNGIACQDSLNIAVGDQCTALITAEMILASNLSDYSDFEVRIYHTMPNPINSPGDVSNPVSPGVYVVGVFEKSTGNNCWSTILVQDKKPPTITCNCPEGGALPKDSQVPKRIKGKFSKANDLSIKIHQDCWDFGTANKLPDHDNHYYDVYPVKVSANATIKITGSDNNKLIVGVYEDYFNSAYVCDNLIDGMGGYVDPVTYEEPQNGGILDNTVDMELGKTYYIVVTDFDAGYEGKYTLRLRAPAGVEITMAEAVYSSDCTYKGCFEEDKYYNFLKPDYTDNCTDGLTLDTVETVVPGPRCGTYIVKRVYTVTDGAGWTASCTSEYFFEGVDMANLEWPVNWDGLPQNHEMLECSDNYPVDAKGNPDPGFTGYPAGYSDACDKIEVFYTDKVYDLKCGSKILRDWTVVDDCTGKLYKHTQIIRITDTAAPDFTVPADIKAKTKAYVCSADVVVPPPTGITDNCDDNPEWWVTIDEGSITGDANNNGVVDNGETWTIINLPLGQYELCYHVKDACKNETVKCIDIEVYDGVPPIAACEQHKQVSITVTGNGKLYAYSLNSGSLDNCNPVYFKVLRVGNDLKYDGGCADLNGDDNPATNANDVWYDDDVFFCCEDDGKDIMVSLRVFDKDPGVGPVNPVRYTESYSLAHPDQGLYGHFNDCWSVVHVENKIPPSLDCHDVTVACDESLDPEENPKLKIDAEGICDFDLSYVDTNRDGLCTSYVLRRWTATTSNGLSSSCLQKIKIEAAKPFDPCKIIFPADITTDCLSELEDESQVTFDGELDPCNIISIHHHDDTFTFVENACYKIMREWAVLDLCVYEPNTGAEDNVDAVIGRRLDCNKLVADGYYRYTQTIMVTDTKPPKVEVEDQCFATVGCFAEDVTLTAHATDECNVDQKFFWKYIVTDVDTWETVQYSYNYTPVPSQGVKGNVAYDNLFATADASLKILNDLPIGNYRVTWTAGDGCGNVTTVNQYFTVADKKPPTPILVDLATAVMTNGMVELKAKSFDKGECGEGCVASRDNCTPSYGLMFTFTPVLPRLDVNPQKWQQQLNTYGKYFFDPVTGLIKDIDDFESGDADAWLPLENTSVRRFFCDYDEGSDYTKTIDIYVWDKFALDEECDDGNYDYATVEINFNHCSQGTNSIVSGFVNNSNHSGPFRGFRMDLSNLEYNYTAETDDNGRFVFKNIPDDNYKLSGALQEEYLNGISTLDLVLLQKHILGMKEITNPYRLIAADVNNNKRITSADILELRKVLLGKKDKFKNDSWVAISKDYYFQNPFKAYLEVDKAKVKDITVDGANITNLKFIAIKIGDINGNSSGLTERSDNSMSLMLDNRDVEKGQTIEIPVYARDFKDISGLQFAVKTPGLTVSDIQAGALDVNAGNYNITGDEILFSWQNAYDKSVNDDEVLFTIIAKANVTDKLNNMLHIDGNRLSPEAYTSDLQINRLSLDYRNAENYALYQNEPNPFAIKTTIGFVLPESGQYTLTVYDITGKVLKLIEKFGDAGYNSVQLTKDDIDNTTGVLYYKLESGDFVATKKMIVIK